MSGLTFIPLWPGDPPGGGTGPSEPEQTSGLIKYVHTPGLIEHPPQGTPKASVVVISGGGYEYIDQQNESCPASEWLAQHDVLAYELICRLPNENWPAGATFVDGQRALRMARYLAQQNGLTEVGVLGFSAGAHLAGLTAVRSAEPLYQHVDNIDDFTARPDFAGLIYPILDMSISSKTNTYKSLFLNGATQAEADALSADKHVGADCPRIFLAQAFDDPVSPLDNTLLTFAALRSAGKATAMHVFSAGKHGWGMGDPGSEVAAWPDLFATWAGLD